MYETDCGPVAVLPPVSVNVFVQVAVQVCMGAGEALIIPFNVGALIVTVPLKPVL